MDCIDYRVSKSQTQISDFRFASELTKKAQLFVLFCFPLKIAQAVLDRNHTQTTTFTLNHMIFSTLSEVQMNFCFP